MERGKMMYFVAAFGVGRGECTITGTSPQVMEYLPQLLHHEGKAWRSTWNSWTFGIRAGGRTAHSALGGTSSQEAGTTSGT